MIHTIFLTIINLMRGGDKKQQARRQEMAAITNFQGFYEFLSMDYPAWVDYQGIVFPSITTAFQAARSTNLKIRKAISEVTDFDQFKKLVSIVKNPQDWPTRREQVMEKLIRDKFKRNKNISLKLAATQSRQLINSYKKGGEYESYWGMIEKKQGKRSGNNALGKILIKIREEIHKGTDSEHWIKNQHLQPDQQLRAQVTVIIQKDDSSIDTWQLGSKQYYILGCLNNNDFILQHPSISKYHAAIYFSTDVSVLIVDLNSTHGTVIFRNGTQIKLAHLIPHKLETGDKIMFGQSVRKYIVGINNQRIEHYIRQKQKEAEEELRKIEELKRIELQHMEQVSQINAIKCLLSLKNYACLYVQNISRNYPYKYLKQTFNKYGSVKNIKINIDQKTGRYMGSVLVYYDEKVKISGILDNIRENPINQEFRIMAVDQQEAEKIIEAFSQNKKAEAKLEEVVAQKQAKKQAIRGERSRRKHSRSSSSSSSSSSEDRSRDKKRKKKHRKHRK